LFTISCKNKKGFFAKGRKVIDINFTCTRQALVTTADSRIRYIDLIEREQKFKYKGHINKSMNIRTSLSGDLELIMSASEDGKIYLWRNVEMEDSSKAIGSKGNDRSDDHQTFFATTNDNDNSKIPSKHDRKSTSTRSACTIFAPLEVVNNVNSKLMNNGIRTRLVKQIILVATLDGRLKVFHSEISTQKTFALKHK